MKKLLTSLFILGSLTAFAAENPFDVFDSGNVYTFTFKNYNYSSIYSSELSIYSDKPGHYRVQTRDSSCITEFLAITNEWCLSDEELYTRTVNIAGSYSETYYFMDFGCGNMPNKMLRDSHFDNSRIKDFGTEAIWD